MWMILHPCTYKIYLTARWAISKLVPKDAQTKGILNKSSPRQVSVHSGLAANLFESAESLSVERAANNCHRLTSWNKIERSATLWQTTFEVQFSSFFAHFYDQFAHVCGHFRFFEVTCCTLLRSFFEQNFLAFPILFTDFWLKCWIFFLVRLSKRKTVSPCTRLQWTIQWSRRMMDGCFWSCSEVWLLNYFTQNQGEAHWGYKTKHCPRKRGRRLSEQLRQAKNSSGFTPVEVWHRCCSDLGLTRVQKIESIASVQSSGFYPMWSRKYRSNQTLEVSTWSPIGHFGPVVDRTGHYL